MTRTGTPVGTVAEIWRYPVKSMGGHRIDSAALGRLGIPGDRRHALRDLDSGKIISAKLPRFGRELLGLHADVDSDGRVEVSDGGSVVGNAGDVSLDELLSDRLGIAVRVEEATEADEVYASYWPEIDGVALSDIEADLPVAMMTDKGTFVDLAALHIVATGSMRHFASLLPDSEVSSRRFRPSIVIESDEGGSFVDNGWCDRTATLGAARISITTAAPRCVMTTLPQGDLPADKAILRTLAEENRIGLEGFGDFACFGVYAEVVEPGLVTTGDALVLDP